jgi:DNA-binding YbaB/EbfC family protein
MLKGLGGLGDMAAMMKTAQDMQVRVAELQAEMARTVVIGDAGDGLVRARATCKGEVTGLDISAQVLAGDKEAAEDLILAAIKDAQNKGQARNMVEMQKLTQSLGLPADFKLPL